MRSGNHDQKNMYVNVSKHILNISRAALFQNFLRTEQLKYNCLAQTIDYTWESLKARQKAISRLRVH